MVITEGFVHCRELVEQDRTLELRQCALARQSHAHRLGSRQPGAGGDAIPSGGPGGDGGDGGDGALPVRRLTVGSQLCGGGGEAGAEADEADDDACSACAFTCALVCALVVAVSGPPAAKSVTRSSR